MEYLRQDCAVPHLTRLPCPAHQNVTKCYAKSRMRRPVTTPQTGVSSPPGILPNEPNLQPSASQPKLQLNQVTITKCKMLHRAFSELASFVTFSFSRPHRNPMHKSAQSCTKTPSMPSPRALISPPDLRPPDLPGHKPTRKAGRSNLSMTYGYFRDIRRP